MTSLILNGKQLAASNETTLRERALAAAEVLERSPKLATVLVGDDPASATYVKMKQRACQRMAVESMAVEIPASTPAADVYRAITEISDDPSVDGILVQHPLPSHVDTRTAFDSIAIEKDVDGVTSGGFGAMAMGAPAYAACTPAGIMELLEHNGVELSGKRALVIGRSPILGRPMALLLMHANATVTIAHSRTSNLAEEVRRAEIVVAAIGKPKFVRSSWISDGTVVVDAGFHPAERCGDVEIDDALIERVSAYTPVPGGVGPMTINRLITQTIMSAEKTARGL